MADELIPLKISPGILSDIYREARSAFPAECCGWLSGPKDGDEVTVVRPASIIGAMYGCVNRA